MLQLVVTMFLYDHRLGMNQKNYLDNVPSLLRVNWVTGEANWEKPSFHRTISPVKSLAGSWWTHDASGSCIELMNSSTPAHHRTNVFSHHRAHKASLHSRSGHDRLVTLILRIGGAWHEPKEELNCSVFQQSQN